MLSCDRVTLLLMFDLFLWQVFVLKDGKSVPIITGVISMPVSEGLVVVWGPRVISMSGSEGLVVVWGHWGQARVIWGHIWRHLKSMQRTMVTGFGIILVVNPYSQKLNCFNLFNYFLPVIQVTVHDEKKYYIFFYFVSYEVKELFTYLFNTTQYAWFDKFMFEDNRNTSILSWSVCMSTISIASIWLYTYLWCHFNYNSFKEQ